MITEYTLNRFKLKPFGWHFLGFVILVIGFNVLNEATWWIGIPIFILTIICFNKFLEREVNHWILNKARVIKK